MEAASSAKNVYSRPSRLSVLPQNFGLGTYTTPVVASKLLMVHGPEVAILPDITSAAKLVVSVTDAGRMTAL